MRTGIDFKYRVWDGVDYMSKPFTLLDIQAPTRIEFTKDVIVMQYTDTMDVSGLKQVCESDIVSGNWCYGEIGVVTLDRKRFEMYVRPFDYRGRLSDQRRYRLNSAKLTVLGNIYQHPELLPSESTIHTNLLPLQTGRLIFVSTQNSKE